MDTVDQSRELRRLVGFARARLYRGELTDYDLWVNFGMSQRTYFRRLQAALRNHRNCPNKVMRIALLQMCRNRLGTPSDLTIDQFRVSGRTPEGHVQR